MSARISSYNGHSSAKWSMYNNCRVSMGKQLYLSEDFNFEASRLKLLARTNCLSLNATLFRMSLPKLDTHMITGEHIIDLTKNICPYIFI
jgi:hypothetical protein